MNEEEKQAIKYFYNLRATIDESNMLFDEDINIKCGKEMIKQITTVLNLLEKKDKKIEDWKMEYNHWCQLAIDRKKELENKDKIIYEMIDFIDAIDGCLCFDLESRNCIDKNCKECIKQYFERKVEK